jgi:transposase
VVPPDHLVRQIDAVLDLNWVHKELAPHYSHTGRPSIDPVLMIRMLIVGVFAIRSERRICAEVQVNLAYRWFCKLGIEDSIPDPSVFCRAWHERFRESDAFAPGFRGCGGEVHRGWAGWWRGVFDRCEPDQGRRGQEEAGAWRSADCLAEGRGGIPCGSRVPHGFRCRPQ